MTFLKYAFSLVGLFLFSFQLMAFVPNPKDVTDDILIVQASFPGGSDAWHEYVQTNIVYPELAREYGIEGEVVLSIRLSAEGEISTIRPIKELGFGCDEEAIRLVESGPKWVPAEIQGQAIISQVILSFHFELR